MLTGSPLAACELLAGSQHLPGAVNKMQDLTYSMKREMLRRKYSIRTIRAYVFCVNQFFRICHKELKRINKKDIEDYLYRFVEKNAAGNTINVHLNALKFFFEESLRKRLTINIKYSKIPKKLPEFLTKDEFIRLVNAIENKKHKLIVKLIYSAGLRVGELVNLRVKNLELEKNYGWVRQGKGNKDRLFIIAEKLKDEIKEFIKNNNLNNEDWLFKGNNRNHLSIESIQNIIKKAAKIAKINKNVHPHTLRHSFATHLIENGYDVASVQSLLGHNSMQTTMIYLHLAGNMLNVKSPFDSLY